MAQIRTYPLLSHLRSEPTSFVIRFKGGVEKQAGIGLAFWFRPLDSALVEVPIDDRELPFLFKGRSSDYQEVSVQGALTYRVADAHILAKRVDFSIDLEKGNYLKNPLEQLSGLLTQIAQGFITGYLVDTPLETLLTSGIKEIDRKLTEGFAKDNRLLELGIEVPALSVVAVKPAPEVERALQMPRLEKLQSAADAATFERRAQAVEQERSISENEMQNQIELSKREEILVSQQGINNKRRAEEKALADEILSESLSSQATTRAKAEAEEVRLRGSAEAERITLVETARNASEEEKMSALAKIPESVLYALAIRELASNIPSIESLTITPDMLTKALAQLTSKRD